MISKDVGMTTTIVSGAGGGATALLDFLNILGAHGTAFGLMLSAGGIMIGIVFKILDLREKKRSNMANERIRILEITDR